MPFRQKIRSRDRDYSREAGGSGLARVSAEVGKNTEGGG